MPGVWIFFGIFENGRTDGSRFTFTHDGGSDNARLSGFFHFFFRFFFDELSSQLSQIYIVLYLRLVQLSYAVESLKGSQVN